MSEEIQYDRRRFIETAMMATAGAGLLRSRLREPASRDDSSLAAIRTYTNASPGPTRQMVGYAEAGPSNGPPAILLHESSYSVNSEVDVAPLAARGYRVIVPCVRSLGTKRLLLRNAVRDGRQTAGTSDVMALIDALKIEKALVGGFDGSARTAEVAASLWPQRIKAIVPSCCVAVSLAANQRPLPPKEELAWWYQYYFARAGLSANTIVQLSRAVSRANV